MKKPLSENRIWDTLCATAGIRGLQSGNSVASQALLAGVSFRAGVTFRFAEIRHPMNYREEVQELCRVTREFRRSITRHFVKKESSYPSIRETAKLFSNFNDAIISHKLLNQLPYQQKNFLENQLLQTKFVLCHADKRTAKIRQAESIGQLFSAISLVLCDYIVTSKNTRKVLNKDDQPGLHDYLEESRRIIQNHRVCYSSSDTHLHTVREIMPDFSDFSNRVRAYLESVQTDNHRVSPANLRRFFNISTASRQSFMARANSAIDQVKEIVVTLTEDKSPDYQELKTKLKSIFDNLEKSADNFRNQLSLNYHPLGMMFLSLYLYTFATSKDKRADPLMYKKIMQVMVSLIEEEAKWVSHTMAGATYQMKNEKEMPEKRVASTVANLGPHYHVDGYINHFLRPSFDLGALLYPLFRRRDLRSGLASLTRAYQGQVKRSQALEGMDTGITFKQYGLGFGIDLPDRVLKEITELQKGRLIDSKKKGKQSGLYTIIPPEEIRARVTDNNAVVHCIYQADKLVGTYLICSDQNSMPELGHELLQILKSSHVISEDRKSNPVVLVDLVAQAKDTFMFSLSSGTSPGQLAMPFLDALVQAQVPYADKVTCMGICRVNPAENKTLERALKDGWKRVKDADGKDVVYSSDGIDYAVITYDYDSATLSL